MKIKVCQASKCKKCGSEEIYQELLFLSKKVNKKIKKEGLDKKELKIKKTSCQSNCKNGPSVEIKGKKITGDYKKIKKAICKHYEI